MRPRGYGGYEGPGGRKRPIDEILGGGDNRPIKSPGKITGPVSQPTAIPPTAPGAGGTNPWVNPFMEVYETTKASSLQNLAEMQKAMEDRFAHRGGYFGGKHAIAQGEMAAETGTMLDQLLAQTSLGASEREYQDWLRARQEEFMPMNLISMLLGTDAFQNIVQMPQQGSGGILGNLLGGLAGSFLGPFGAAGGSWLGDQVFG